METNCVMGIEKIKKSLSGTIYSALSETCPDITENDIFAMLAYPPNPDMGDLSLPCFKFAKALKKAPPAIAGDLKEIVKSNENVESACVMGGYLNVFFDKSRFAGHVISEINSEGFDCGKTDKGKDKTVVMDYSSPNVAKPFHIGHLGTTVIGHSIRKLHEWAGYKVISVNHLGDWGTQFGKLIVAYRMFGSEKDIEERGIDALVDIYVRFHEEAEKDDSLNDRAREEFTKLENGDEENRKLWKRFIDISIAEYKKTYAQLDIEFDYYTGESFYSDKIPAVLEELEEKNLLEKDEGASIVRLDEYDLPPCLILKSDGSTLYAARDITAALYRKNTFDFDKSIYVTDAGQSLHFKQFFSVIGKMGYEWSKQLIHIPYGKVSIDGAKLATRTGNVILLRDLFKTAEDKVRAVIEEKQTEIDDIDSVCEAVGVGAVVFHYLSNSRIKDINFVMDEALSFDGDTGPYAQYTYARTCGIVSKAKETGYSGSSSYSPTEDCEYELIKSLSRFSEKVDEALSGYEPMVITRYILELCSLFNRFYHDCKILTAESEEVRNFRTALTESVRYVLGAALGLICMKKTERI